MDKSGAMPAALLARCEMLLKSRDSHRPAHTLGFTAQCLLHWQVIAIGLPSHDVEGLEGMARDFRSIGCDTGNDDLANWTKAQSDLAIDQLQLRQTELSVAKEAKQAQVDVMNALVALQQARARYESAVRNRILAEKLLKAEQRKFSLGASTPYEVIQQQRDLTTAQSNEVATLVAHSNARIRMDQTLGTILETNHISVTDVMKGVMPPAK